MARALRSTLWFFQVISTVFAMLAVPHTVTAQQASLLRAGDVVRVTVTPPSSERIQRRLVSLAPHALVLAGAKTTEPIDFSTIGLLEVKRRSGDSVLRSVGFGLLGGAVGGAIIGGALGSGSTFDGQSAAGLAAFGGAVLGGVAGIVGGTLYGMCCSGSWHATPVPTS